MQLQLQSTSHRSWWRGNGVVTGGGRGGDRSKPDVDVPGWGRCYSHSQGSCYSHSHNLRRCYSHSLGRCYSHKLVQP